MILRGEGPNVGSGLLPFQGGLMVTAESISSTTVCDLIRVPAVSRYTAPNPEIERMARKG
jgi:hypothetical protein